MDVSIAITVYAPYKKLVSGMLDHVVEFWPEYPPLVIDFDTSKFLGRRILALLKRINTEYVVILHEDYWLCAAVKQRQFNYCLDYMRRHTDILSCSLTWELITLGMKRGDIFELPNNSPYSFNLQARIWRRQLLINVLEKINLDAEHHEIEPFCSNAVRELRYRMVTYPIIAPEKHDHTPDANDKSNWVLPYNNIATANGIRGEWLSLVPEGSRF